MLTEAMVRKIDKAVTEIAATVGFGSVTIIIEKGRPRRVQREFDEWLEEREPDPPPRQGVRQLTTT